jgi:hypothetical protein
MGAASVLQLIQWYRFISQQARNIVVDRKQVPAIVLDEPIVGRAGHDPPAAILDPTRRNRPLYLV